MTNFEEQYQDHKRRVLDELVGTSSLSSFNGGVCYPIFQNPTIFEQDSKGHVFDKKNCPEPTSMEEVLKRPLSLTNFY